MAVLKAAHHNLYIYQKLRDWFLDHRTLFQAFWVALSLHVALLPVLWVAGWALPWPRSPIFTTVVEYDLRGWPNLAKPKKIYETIHFDGAK